VIQTLLEIYKRLPSPQLLLNLLAGDQLARAAGEQGEELERLRGQMDEPSRFAHFTRLEVQFKYSEAQTRCRGSTHTHDPA
jgi:hypothetical protein